MFDRDQIPNGVVSQAGVDRVNQAAERLRETLVGRIELQEKGSTFRLSNMIRSIDQAFVRRSLHLAEASANLLVQNYGLAATILARCVFETVACYRDFSINVTRRIDGAKSIDDVKDLHDYVTGFGFATRVEELVRLSGDDSTKARSVITQIDNMKGDRASIRSDYDYLSEFAHPNGLGTLLYFGVREEGDAMSFDRPGPSPEEEYQWTLVGAQLLVHLETHLKNVESRLETLSKLGSELLQTSKK